MCFEPGLVILDGPWFEVEGRGGFEDGFVEDLRDGGRSDSVACRTVVMGVPLNSERNIVVDCAS